MARLSRAVIPGIPHHVTERGNGRSQTFRWQALAVLKMIAAISLTICLTSSGCASAVGSKRKQGPQAQLVIHPITIRQLPFQLQLERELPPNSLTEFAEKLFNSIPPQHLRAIGTYFGGRGNRTARHKYASEIEYYRSLYSEEIMTAAYEAWNSDVSLSAQIECMGGKLQFQQAVMLFLGFRYLEDQDDPVESQNMERQNGYMRAERMARRLMHVCDKYAGGGS
jgi:hypothetical protein